MASPVHNPILRASLLLAMAVAASALAPGAMAQAPAPDHREPVLVELFTSEGCSDCPPADALLAELDSTQFVPGAQAIVLSEHVTYWNREGWTDPFSLDAMTDRQQQYKLQFGLSDVYTPQMVVDGAEQMVGNDRNKVESAITRAAATPKLEMQILNAHQAADRSVEFSVHVPAVPKATLVAALAESATRSEVARGENKGRTLNHVAVVRVLKDFGSSATDGRPLRLSGPKRSGAEATGNPLRLVVFLVNHKNGHVVAVAEQTLSQ
jgi:hypothetical protein